LAEGKATGGVLPEGCAGEEHRGQILGDGRSRNGLKTSGINESGVFRKSVVCLWLAEVAGGRRTLGRKKRGSGGILRDNDWGDLI